MKVRELIEKLQKMNPDAEIYVNQTDCCERIGKAEMVWSTCESERDYSKRYNDPEAYKIVDAVRID